MSTLTKNKLISSIRDLAAKIKVEYDDNSLEGKSRQELIKLYAFLKRKVALQESSTEELKEMATDRMDGCLGQQRNKGAIAELLRRGRIGSY